MCERVHVRLCVWADGSFVGDVRFHMGKHTLLRLDNYTGLGQGLVALKTNAHIHTQNIVRALSSRQPQVLLHSSDYSEPQWSHLLWNTQQHVWHSIGQEFLYAYTNMVVFHVSDSERLSGEELQYAYREYWKAREAPCARLPANELQREGDKEYRGPCRYMKTQYNRLNPLMVMSGVCAVSQQGGVCGKARSSAHH